MKTFYLAVSCLVIMLSASLAIAKNDKHKNKHNSLPPGLQKNLERGKPLPPGWEKKLRKGDILDLDVYNHGKIVVPLDKHGLITLSVEGRLIRLIKDTREIVEILK